MPELPEVETVKRVLESWIIGKKVAKVRVRYAPIFDNANEEILNSVLVGQTIEKIERYGKFLVFVYQKNVIQYYYSSCKTPRKPRNLHYLQTNYKLSK